MRRFSLLFLGISLLITPLAAQESPDELSDGDLQLIPPEERPEEEAQPYLWNYTLGSSEVELFWEGYWKFGFYTGLGFARVDDQWIFPSQYPDMASLPVFDQEPNLFLSLWLDQRFYLETSFVKDYNNNIYALGYQNPEDGFLRHIRLANSDLQAQGFAGLTPWAPQYNTPGILVETAGERSQQELLIRLEGTREEKLIFQGQYQVSEEIQDLRNWQEGCYFLLPDLNPDIQSFRLYLQSTDWTLQDQQNRGYRLLEPGEYQLDSQAGLVYFSQPVNGNLAVYYEVSGQPLGDSSLATLPLPGLESDHRTLDLENSHFFSWSQTNPFSVVGLNYQESMGVTLEGRLCLILKRPGRFSPFELSSSYSSSIQPSDELWKNGFEIQGMENPEDLGLRLDSSQENFQMIVEGSTIRSLEQRYPFYPLDPSLYGPEAKSYQGGELYKIRLYRLGEAGEYQLPSDYIQGSVEIRINESQTVGFIIDESNKVQFQEFILPSDRIEISYRQENSEYSGGRVLAYQGNQFQLSENSLLEIGLEGRWLLPGSEMAGQEGAVILSLLQDYQGENLQSRISAQGRLINPDTLGYYSISSMEGGRESLSVSPDFLGPSYDDFPSVDAALNLEPADYIPMVERDYSNNLGELQNYLYSSAEEQTSLGASAALSQSSDPFDSPVVVLPIDLESSEWTGTNLFLLENWSDYRNLAQLETIHFRLRMLDTPLTGLAGISLVLGNSGEGEDRNQDNLVDPPEDYWRKDLDSSILPDLSDQEWHSISIDLTDQDRSRLSAARTLSLLVYEEGRDAPLECTLLAADFQLELRQGQGRILETPGEVPGEAPLEIRQILDTSLGQSFSEELSYFNDNLNQRVTRIGWGSALNGETQDLSANQYWQYTMSPSTPLEGHYRFLSFFVRADQLGGNYAFHFRDQSGEQIEIGLSPGDTEWIKIEMDLQEQRVNASSGNVEILRWDAPLTGYIEMTLEGHNLSQGYFYVDEVYQWESIYRWEEQLVWDLQYRSPFEWTSSGGFPLFSNFSLTNQVEYLGSQLPQLDSNSYGVNQKITTGAQLGPLMLTLHGSNQWLQDNWDSQWGHGLTLPHGFESPLSYQEEYRFPQGKGQQYYSQDRNLIFTEEIISVHLGQSAYLEEQIHQQSWSYDLQLAPHENLNLIQQLNILQRNDGFEQDKDLNYWTGWARGWESIVPQDNEPLLRESLLNQQLVYSSPRVETSWDLNLKSSHSPLQEWMADQSYLSALSCTIELSPDLETFSQWGELQLKYQRSRDWKEEQQGWGYFQEDWSSYFSHLAENLPLTSELPFGEIYDQSYTPVWLSDQSIAEQRYNVLWSLGYSRPLVSHWSSLVLPVGLSFSQTRQFKRIRNSQSYETSIWTSEIEHRWENLWGDFGAYRLFGFYQSDSLQSRLTLNQESLNAAIPQVQSLEWYVYGALKGEREWTTTLEHNYTWDFQNEGQTQQLDLGINWRSRSKDFYQFPFSDTIIDRPFYAEHQEKIQWNRQVSQGEPQAWELSFLHRWILNFSGFGTFTSQLDLGYREEKDNLQMGVELGLEFLLNLGE